MAYVVKANMVMACIVMAYIVRACIELWPVWLYGHGVYSHGVYGYGLFLSYGFHKGADIFTGRSGIYDTWHHACLARCHVPQNTDCDPWG